MADFLTELAKKTGSADLQTVEEEIFKSPYFPLYTKENTEYYYPGIDYNFKPVGVKECLCLTDYISNAGSVVYVIIPASAENAEKLAEDLKQNADPGWMNFEQPTDGLVSKAIDGRVYFSVYDTNMKPVEGKIAAGPRDFVDIFHDYLSKHPEASATELAEYFVSHQKFNSLRAGKIESERIMGIGSFDSDFILTGYSEGAGFVPLISPNLFIGYVFITDDSTDTDAFVSDLKENANLSWNVCMTANTVITETDGKYVLFMMCSE